MGVIVAVVAEPTLVGSAGWQLTPQSRLAIQLLVVLAIVAVAVRIALEAGVDQRVRGLTLVAVPLVLFAALELGRLYDLWELSRRGELAVLLAAVCFLALGAAVVVVSFLPSVDDG